MFKKDNTVAVCYDGKLTRAVQGKVTFISPKGRELTVKFLLWANEEAGFILDSFRRSNEIGEVGSIGKTFTYYTGIIKGRGEFGIQKFLLGYSGDYYTVLPESVVIEEGYTVEPYHRKAI